MGNAPAEEDVTAEEQSDKQHHGTNSNTVRLVGISLKDSMSSGVGCNRRPEIQRDGKPAESEHRLAGVENSNKSPRVSTAPLLK